MLARNVKDFAGRLSAVASTLQRGFAVASMDEKFTVQVQPYKTHKIESPSQEVETSLGELIGMYHLMYKMRRMEIAADMMYKARLIRGFCHLYDGQEAVMTGIEYAITKKDSVITSYRDHCHVLARGGTVKGVMSELMGKKDGETRGVGGSMHMYSKENGFYGGCGIVGAQIPLGAGLGFRHHYEKDGCIAITMYGDGAANQGQNFEALNMAGLWDLPVIFVCENNHYGMGTAEWRAAKSPVFYTRGDYIPGLKVDGMDVLAVKNAVTFAKQHVLANGPIILEMDTYRYHGHSMSDPGSTYRTRDEISAMRQKRDPVEHVRKLLLENGFDAAEIKKIDKEVKKEVDTAVEESKAAAIPPDTWLWKNVYVSPEHALLRDMDGTYKKSNYDPAYANP